MKWKYALVASSVLAAATVSADTISVKDGESIQAAINRAQRGDKVQVMPGLYKESLYIDKDNLTLSGVVQNGQWPVLDGENVRSDGILAPGHGVVIERLHVKRFLGNGIMTQGANNFTIAGNRVEGPGFYGIFPQYGKNGLVAHNIVSHIDGTGIYVGMSQNIDVLFNEVFENKGFGIELENSNDALIEGNYTHGNFIGIVLNLIPGLPVKEQKRIVVRNNFVIDNKGAADSSGDEGTASVIGSGAGQAPQGTGLLVNGSDVSTIEHNLFRGNVSTAIFVMDHHFGQIFPVPDAKVDPLPDDTRILDNTFIDNGAAPAGRVKAILAALKEDRGPDLLVAGRGRNNCVLYKGSMTSLGAEAWSDCSDDLSSEELSTMRLSEPVKSPSLSLQQKGRLTYLAVCTGCHSYSTRIVGPPMIAARAGYAGEPERLAQWLANPTKQRDDYPAMPPQAYLPPDVRLEVAKYVLEHLEP